MKTTQSKTCVFVWFLILLTAFAARASVAVYWDVKTRNNPNSLDSYSPNEISSFPPAAFFFGDSDSYWKLGRTIAFGRPYEFDNERRWQIFRSPGYPVILAPLFLFFGENPPTLVARFLGVLFGTLNVLLIGVLAKSLLRFPKSDKMELTHILAGAFAALEPTMVLQSVLILSEESFLTFALLQNIVILELSRLLGLLPYPSRDLKAFAKPQVYIEWNAPQNLTYTRVFLLSALLGLTTAGAIYIRPSWYYYLPCFIAFVLLQRFYAGNAHEIDDYHYTRFANLFSRRKILFSAFTILVITFLALSPWIVRNYKLTRRIIPTTLQMGASLYDGLNPNADGASNMNFVDDFRQIEAKSSDSSMEHFEVRLDRRMKEAALSWSLKNPRRVLELALIKAYRLWTPFPREKSFSKPIIVICLFVSYVPIFIMGLLGAYRSIKLKGAAWTLLLPAAYVTLLHSIFVSSIRYRTPVLYGFFILSAYWICSRLSKFLDKESATQNK